MDWFSFLLVVFTLTGISITHIVFIARITGKGWKTRQMIVYFIILCRTDNRILPLSPYYKFPARPFSRTDGGC